MEGIESPAEAQAESLAIDSSAVANRSPRESLQGGRSRESVSQVKLAVDLVVLVDQEVTVRHGKCPLDAIGREDIERGEPIGGFAKLHHQ